MKVNVKGTVLEKFTKEATVDGQKQERLFVRLFQPGVRMNLDVNVKGSTYSEVKEGQVIELKDIYVSSYRDVLYMKQQ